MVVEQAMPLTLITSVFDLERAVSNQEPNRGGVWPVLVPSTCGPAANSVAGGWLWRFFLLLFARIHIIPAQPVVPTPPVHPDRHETPSASRALKARVPADSGSPEHVEDDELEWLKSQVKAGGPMSARREAGDLDSSGTVARCSDVDHGSILTLELLLSFASFHYV
jgi:hypothetical protein